MATGSSDDILQARGVRDRIMEEPTITVRIKESSTAKSDTPPAVEVTATGQVTDVERENAIRQATMAYYQIRGVLDRAKQEVIINIPEQVEP